MKTKVKFYFATYDEGATEVLAVFVDEKVDYNLMSGDIYLNCYAHFGQHSICSETFLAEKAREATKEEYQDLLKELTNVVGYSLEII